MKDSFGAASELESGGTTYRIHRLDALGDRFPVDSLPYSLKVLLENVLRLEDGVAVTSADAEAIARLLGIPPNTAASRYRYGIDKLRARLRPFYEEIR